MREMSSAESSLMPSKLFVDSCIKNQSYRKIEQEPKAYLLNGIRYFNPVLKNQDHSEKAKLVKNITYSHSSMISKYGIIRMNKKSP